MNELRVYYQFTNNKFKHNLQSLEIKKKNKVLKKLQKKNKRCHSFYMPSVSPSGIYIYINFPQNV